MANASPSVQRRPSLNDRNAAARIVRVGLARNYFDDLYHYLLITRWSHLIGIIALCYLALNAFFACLYLLGDDAIAGADPDSIRDAFFFSVQTFSTIGYGTMAPKGLYGGVIVTAEALVGLLGVAIASGLMFAKFARPTSRVMFSQQLLITTREGKPCLMFRMANERSNDVVEAFARVTMLSNEVSPEGHRLRRLRDLKLLRNNIPIFLMSWTAMHIIDKESPLYGETEESLQNGSIRFIVLFTGLDGTFASTIHARHVYAGHDVVWGGTFLDMTSELPEDRVQVDFSALSKIAPLPPGTPKPVTRPAGQTESLAPPSLTSIEPDDG